MGLSIKDKNLILMRAVDTLFNAIDGLNTNISLLHPAFHDRLANAKNAMDSDHVRHALRISDDELWVPSRYREKLPPPIEPETEEK